MFVTVRIAIVAALGALLVLPLWGMNRTMDGLIVQDGARPHIAAMTGMGDAVLARLNGVKAEIQADICSRGETRYCLGGLCVPVPAARSCAQK